MWWLFILPPFAFLLLTAAVACYVKNREDKRTLKRNLELYVACKRTQEKYLKGTGVHLNTGSYGAWLEVIDEKREGEFPLVDFY